MRRRQILMQRAAESAKVEGVTVEKPSTPEIKCHCGRVFKSEHALKIHSARCKKV